MSAWLGQTLTLTGEVAIQSGGEDEDGAADRRASRRAACGEVSLVLMPAKKSAEAKRTTPST